MIALGLEDYNDGILPTASVCVFPVKVEVARRTLSLIDLTNKVKICSGIESTFSVSITTYTPLKKDEEAAGQKERTVQANDT